MRCSRLFAVALLILLAACSGSHRPVYSGHEESTEGVPGFVNGKKISPYVKLGQSYSVDGETYVPRNQPDYVEEGMASWYGPGFHGGKTANGESFDSNALTAAHRTLPLPSIIKVTLLSTGKSAYVRVNDRGPFAHSRIIDLSRAAAEKIGLLRVGVGKVRIEYMKKESERFAQLLADGKQPEDIDVENEIIHYDGDTAPPRAEFASAQAGGMPQPAAPAANRSSSFWDNFGVSDASAAEPEQPAASAEAVSVQTNDGAPVSDITANDLNAPQLTSAGQLPAAAPEPLSDDSPFRIMQTAPTVTPQASAPGSMRVASLASPAAPGVAAAASGSLYLQLGAFSNEQNAERLRDKFAGTSNVTILRKASAQGMTLYHVRMGPFASSEASAQAQQQLATQGTDAKIIRE